MGIKKTVNYVAQLDGATQYWQLSEPLIIDSNDDYEFALNLLAEINEFYIFGSATTLTDNRLVVYGNGSGLLGLGENEQINWSAFNNLNELRVSRVSGVFSVYYGGDLLTQSSGNTTSFQISRIGGRYDGSTAINPLKGRVSNFEFSRGGVLENKIPLTNKAQGATQLATVGNVNATMVGYNENVWVKASGWYNPTTFQIYENKQIPEGEQINEL